MLLLYRKAPINLPQKDYSNSMAIAVTVNNLYDLVLPQP